MKPASEHRTRKSNFTCKHFDGPSFSGLTVKHIEGAADMAILQRREPPNFVVPQFS